MQTWIPFSRLWLKVRENTAQFEARLNGIQEAVSSILSSSTR